MAIRSLGLCLAAALLSACGFQPMYGSPTSSGSLFRSVQVTEQTDSGRVGYLVQDALQSELTADGAPDTTANLLIGVYERRVNLGVRGDEASVRWDLYLTVNFKLDRVDESGNALKPIKGKVTSVTTYNINNSPYAEITALSDARVRAADDVAKRVAREIAFRSRS